MFSGVDGRIFTHSYLGLGMETAVHKVANLVLASQRLATANKGEAEFLPLWDPCLPTG